MEAKAFARRQGGARLHHVAFRAATMPRGPRWCAARSDAHGCIDENRKTQYYDHVYFARQVGILFEIANDNTGFEVRRAPSRRFGTT